ncbi:hypothetical protein BDN70DRAFT_883635 [Pholiota conissans]|uniref:Uncharacterized protein n=1 Tax=Pholiota conissans TaxID=109636 RepID=A0A9P6CWS8_9AGAR|nr:hypothetical protein BDN70DRAFT_883635 [Pholiota conissans]
MTSTIRGWLHRITQSKDYESDSFVDSEWSTIWSRHSSILGPYRASNEEDTSFPQYHTVDVPIRSGDIFGRSLFSLGHGVGLLNVIGDLNRPVEHRYNGAFIGDVGTITEFGGFAYSFNMFLPSFHPLKMLAVHLI